MATAGLRRTQTAAISPENQDEIDEEEDIAEVIQNDQNYTIKRVYKLVLLWTRFWSGFTSFFAGIKNACSSTKKSSNNLQERCDEVKSEVETGVKSNRKDIRFGLSVLLLGISLEAYAEDRNIGILLDITSSSQYLEESKHHINKYVIPNTGLNDNLWLFLLGNFEIQTPALNVSHPVADTSLMSGIRTSHFEWKKDKKKLAQLWEASTSIRKETREAINRVTGQSRGTTRLYDWLAYTSSLVQSIEGSHVVLIYSDLREDDGRKTTRDPPPTIYPFDDAIVKALFVVYDDDWMEVRDRWSQYFKNAGADFDIYPVAASVNLDDALPSNPFPAELPKFKPLRR